MTIDTNKPIIIEYSNYGMSKYAKLVIPPGKLCILVGENNNGKSCLFYGLEWLLFNDPLAKTLINNKQLEQDKNTQLKVKISQDDYFIEICRSVNSVSYDINGKKFDKKLNKQSIFDLDENVYVPGFIYVKNCIYSLFNMQGEDRGLFPISENNDQAIYTLFEKLLGLINSKKILSAAQKEQHELQLQYEYNETDKNAKIQKLNKLKSILNNIDDTKLSNLIQATERLEVILESLNQSYNTIKNGLKYRNVVVPNTIKNDNLVNSINILNKYLVAKSSIEKAIVQKQKIDKIAMTSINTDKLQLCQKIMSRLLECRNRVLNEQTNISTLNNQKNECNYTLAKFKASWDSIEVCPMCGQPKCKDNTHV